MRIAISDLVSVERDHIGMLERFGATVYLYDPDEGRTYTEQLCSMTPEELVHRLGGLKVFARYDYLDGTVEWYRRRFLRDVVPIPRSWHAAFGGSGALLQTVRHEPVPVPWPKGRKTPPEYLRFFNEDPATVQQILDNTEDRPLPALAAPTLTSDQVAQAVACHTSKLRDPLMARLSTQWFIAPVPHLGCEEVGQSRSGGLPDLDSGDRWPSRNGQPLPFLLQINLADVVGAEAEHLPSEGLLSVFFDVDNEPWGFEASDAGSVAMVYTSAKALRRAARPNSTVTEQPERKIQVTRGVGLPNEFEFDIDDDGIADAYFEVVEHLYAGAPSSWLLGYSLPIQDEMREECAACANDAFGMDSDPEDWRLLFQLGSSRALAHQWADDGVLYLWILKSDLESLRFDRVWAIIQSL